MQIQSQMCVYHHAERAIQFFVSIKLDELNTNLSTCVFEMKPTFIVRVRTRLRAATTTVIDGLGGRCVVLPGVLVTNFLFTHSDFIHSDEFTMHDFILSLQFQDVTSFTNICTAQQCD